MFVLTLAAVVSGWLSVAVAAGDDGCLLLTGLDASRTAAFATGSEAALREVYVAGAGERDVAVLRDYAGRGLRLVGVAPRLLRCETVGGGPAVRRLEVIERLSAARAVGAGVDRPLPSGRPRARAIVLRLGGDGRWRVAQVGER